MARNADMRTTSFIIIRLSTAILLLITLLCGCKTAQESAFLHPAFPEIQETQPPVEAYTNVTESEEAIGIVDNEEEGYCLDYNIAEYMKDGMDDPATRELFKEHIDVAQYNAEQLNSTWDIRYFDYDLNDDGFEDKIVVFSSPLHSVGESDAVLIMVKTEEGYVRADSILKTRALRRSDIDEYLAGSIRIMKQKSEGFHTLEVECKERYGWTKYYWVYETYHGNGRYRQKVPVESINIEKDEYLIDYNIAERMKDGMEDHTTREIFKEDIEEIDYIRKSLNPNTAQLEIVFFDVDLNDDGLTDKIAILSSSYHSGTAGDSFCIAINTGNGYVLYNTGVHTCVHMRSDIDGSLAGSIRILKKKNDGFHILEFEGYEHGGYARSYLFYEDGEFRYSLADE